MEILIGKLHFFSLELKSLIFFINTCFSYHKNGIENGPNGTMQALCLVLI